MHCPPMLTRRPTGRVAAVSWRLRYRWLVTWLAHSCERRMRASRLEVARSCWLHATSRLARAVSVATRWAARTASSFSMSSLSSLRSSWRISWTVRREVTYFSCRFCCAAAWLRADRECALEARVRVNWQYAPRVCLAAMAWARRASTVGRSRRSGIHVVVGSTLLGSYVGYARRRSACAGSALVPGLEYATRRSTEPTMWS